MAYGALRMSVQDTFLNYARRQRVPLVIFLVNGVKLQGTLAGFDQHSLIIRRDHQSQLIYKHAISTIVPQSAIPLFESQPKQDFPSEPLGEEFLDI